jgi:hypothetical protein
MNTSTSRGPSLKRLADHPAHDLPDRSVIARPGAEEPATNTAGATSPDTSEPPTAQTLGEQVAAEAHDSFGISYPGEHGLALHSVRIKTSTKDILEDAVDRLRLKVKKAGGDRTRINQASITDRAIEEFVARHCPPDN